MTASSFQNNHLSATARTLCFFPLTNIDWAGELLVLFYPSNNRYLCARLEFFVAVPSRVDYCTLGPGRSPQ